MAPASNKSKRSPASSKKKKKRGGARRDAGPPAKVPRCLPENKLETIKDIQTEHRNIRNWLMKGQLSERVAGTAIHNLEALAKIMMPSEFEVALNELNVEKTAIKQVLDRVSGAEKLEEQTGGDRESDASRSSTVDKRSQDSEK